MFNVHIFLELFDFISFNFLKMTSVQHLNCLESCNFDLLEVMVSESSLLVFARINFTEHHVDTFKDSAYDLHV